MQKFKIPKRESEFQMKTFAILFDCNWDTAWYPVAHTCGEFSLERRNDLEVDFYIMKHFLHHRGLCGYHFIIDDGENVYEIKMGE